MKAKEPRKVGAESQDGGTTSAGAQGVPRQGASTEGVPAEGGAVPGRDVVAGSDPIAGSDLIAGISGDARLEAERLVEEARKAEEERLEAAGAQSTRILEETRTKADAQARAVQAQALSTTRMESRRTSLKVREEALRRALQSARDKLAARVQSDDYRQVLLGWIVEAAIGLNVPEASVSVSAAERELLDRDLLPEAERTVKQLTGRQVALKPAGGDPLIGQGVVLKSADGRLEFNNQVSTRLLRYQSEIRKIVFEALNR